MYQSRITYTVRDASKQRGFISFWVSYPEMRNDSADDPVRYAQELAVVIDEMITGVIESISMHQDIALPAGLKTSPSASADIQELGVLNFSATNGVNARITIPTIDESLVLGNETIDLTAAIVGSFIAWITNPEDLPADWGVGPITHRGDFLRNVMSAYADWGGKKRAAR